MKKGKILIVVLVALLMVSGLVIVGCGEKCNHRCIVAFDENGNRFNFSSSSCGSTVYSCSRTCDVVKNWSNGSRYKNVKCDCN